MEKSPKGKCTCRDSNLWHRFAWRIEITCTIHHTFAPSSKKRRLDDGLPAHMIPSTRESSEDVYMYTWHTKSMVWLTFFLASRGQPVKRLRRQIHGAKQEKLKIRRKKWVSINTNGKIPEGQVYVPRLEPTASIRLADRNHAHYPSRPYTILKKKMAQWRPSSTYDPIHTGVIGKCFHVHLMRQIHNTMLTPLVPQRATNHTEVKVSETTVDVSCT